MSSDLDLIYGTQPKPPPPSDGEEETRGQTPSPREREDHVPVKSSTRKPRKQEPLTTNHDSKQDRLQASNHASMLALSPETLEAVRKVVKNPGKEEVLYVRVSKEEKDTLDDISYTYKRQGMKTSDNEIVRVAINTLLADYKTNGANSLLAILLASLHD